MNTRTPSMNFGRTLIGAAVASVLMAACSPALLKPAGSAQVRNKLTQLQSDPNLSSRSPVALKEADVAVSAAEVPEADAALAAHRVYMADRKVDTARALAEARFAEDRRVTLSEERESARLAARTHEADVAKIDAATARAASAVQKLSADAARSDAEDARMAATGAEEQAMELRRQIDEMQAKVTDRGLVLTLGDVLFSTGRADLKPGATSNLNKLIAFLNDYPNRTAVIEGFTDSVGSEDANMGLSQRRADAVQAYLTGQGIGAIRLTSLGKGESDPVAGNDSASGRQQNRRVEIVISNPPAALK